jgi:hypothetical protein
LRPVTFRYKDAEADGSHSLQYGLIAEEVAKVYPDLVQYDKQGKPFTVYYHLLTPIMIDQLQKAHHPLEAQRTEFSTLKSAVQNQSSALQTQNSTIGALRNAVQLLIVVVAAFVLIGLGAAAYAVSTRTRPLTPWRTRQTEKCTS